MKQSKPIGLMLVLVGVLLITGCYAAGVAQQAAPPSPTPAPAGLAPSLTGTGSESHVAKLTPDLARAETKARGQQHMASQESDLTTLNLALAGSVQPPPGFQSGTSLTQPTPSLAQPTPSGRASYEDPSGFFAIDYPASWELNRAGSEVQFLADARGNAGLAVSIQIKALSPQQVVGRISDMLARRWDRYREIDGGESTLGGYPAYWVEQTYTLSGEPQHGLMAAVMRNRVGILLLAWAHEADFAGLAETFEDMADTLRLADFAEAPAYDRWPTYESDNIVFHYLPKTYVAGDIEQIAAAHQETFDDIVRFLGVEYDGPIHFYLYPSLDALYAATARQSGFAITEGQEVHALWITADDHQSLGHEMTHVVTAQTLGEPSEALLGEGIAVCLDHSGRDHHAEAAELLAAGKLVPLAKALGEAWFDADPAIIYPESGSFACFLLENYGTQRFKALYPAADFQAALQEVYGADLATLEAEWLAMLRGEIPGRTAVPTPQPPARPTTRPAGGMQLTLINHAAQDVCYVLISPSTEDTWGEDWLGSDETIPPGASRTFQLEAGTYDLLAADCDGETMDEYYGVELEGEMEWTIGNVEATAEPTRPARGTPAARTTPTPPYPLPTPAALDGFLCCGSAPGESGNIWSVNYPSGWTVNLLPNNPQQFFGALFAEPNGNALITIIPGANTEPGHPLDTGNVDDWLNRFVQIRQQEVRGFQEFMRQPVSAIPEGRLWGGTWGSGSNRGWEAYLVVVNPVPAVAPGLPQGYLTMFGVRATSRDWNNVSQTYDAMMASLRIKRFGGQPEGLPTREPNQKPFMVRWCPSTCDWMAVEADSEDWVGDCGEPTWLWETTCRTQQR